MDTIVIIALVAGAAAAITLVLEIIYVRRRAEKAPARIEKAVSLGHVVKARRIRDDNYRDRRHENEKFTSATYTYSVDGTEYRYNFYERANAPMEITLYYINNPKHTFWGESKSVGQRGLQLITYLLPLIVFVTVTVVLLQVL